MPMVREREDLVGLFGFGDGGIGVHEVRGGVVLGEEGEHWFALGIVETLYLGIEKESYGERVNI